MSVPHLSFGRRAFRIPIHIRILKSFYVFKASFAIEIRLRCGSVTFRFWKTSVTVSINIRMSVSHLVF